VSVKGVVYLLIVWISFLIGAFFYAFFVLYKKIFFPVMLSMKFNELQKTGDVLLINKKIAYRISLSGIPVNEKSDALSDVYFIEKELMQKVYKGFLLKKIVVYTVTLIFGIGFFIFNTEIWLAFLLIWGILAVHILLDSRKVFGIYNKVKNEEYIIQNIDIEGMNYYRAFFEHDENTGIKEKSLFDSVM
jgi:hypothetical protein